MIEYITQIHVVTTRWVDGKIAPVKRKNNNMYSSMGFNPLAHSETIIATSSIRAKTSRQAHKDNEKLADAIQTIGR